MTALRKLLFGETWLLPGGIAALLLTSGLVLKPLLGDAWEDAGGALLLAGVLSLLVVAVRRGS